MKLEYVTYAPASYDFYKIVKQVPQHIRNEFMQDPHLPSSPEIENFLLAAQKQLLEVPFR